MTASSAFIRIGFRRLRCIRCSVGVLTQRLVIALVFGVLTTTASAQNQFIDEWASPEQRTETTGAAGASAFGAETDSSAIGGEREQYVEIVSTNVTSRRISLLADQALSFAEETDVNGFAVIVYDGDEGSVGSSDAAIDNNTGDADPFTPSFSPGLGGIDLTDSSCVAADRGFTLTASTPETDADVTIDVFTSASEWSTFTHTKPELTPPSVWFFGFSSFSQGSGASGPADFSNVNALRITIDPVGSGNDFDISSPIANCGFDLGDAAAITDNPTFGGDDFELDSRIPADGPRHAIAGPRLGTAIDSEETTAAPIDAGAFETGIADNDDGAGSTPDDEDGVTFPPASLSSGLTAGDTYTVTATVTGVGVETPLLCGWIDFSDIEQEAGFGFENDADERVCVSVTDPSPGTSGDTCDDTSAGAGTSFECELDFTIPTDWNGGPEVNDGGTDSAFLARFRVTTDWASTAESDFNGFASDGEVEDYLISSSSLPVNISAFDSRFTDQGLEIDWNTASETRNAAFYLWGDRGDGMELLTPDPIPSGTVDPAQPGRYRHRIPGIAQGEVGELAITAVDLRGDEQVYGVFEAGAFYGEGSVTEPIAWADIRSRTFARVSQHALQPTVPAQAVDFEVAAPGMQTVSWQMLADAGLDLTGVDPSSIAVTRNGKAVARRMVSGDAGGFRPGDEIRFWGEKPAGRDALYLVRYHYRISVDPARARPAQDAATDAPGAGPRFYMARLFQDVDNAYHLATRLADPWYAARLKAGSDDRYATAFTIGSDLVTGEAGRLQVHLAGLTDSHANPDHHVRVAVNGQVVGERIFEGESVQTLDLSLPAGLLVPGANEVTVTAPGGTDAAVDHSLVDTITLDYPAALEVGNDRLLIAAVGAGESFALAGLSGNASVYAWNGDALTAIEAQSTPAYANPDVLFRADFEPNESVPQALAFSTLPGTADYWISTPERLHRPSVVSTVGDNTLFDDAAGADFLIIGHPAFLPVSPDEAHPLNQFIERKRAEGWNPAVFDITELQRHYTGAMALPEAVNRFLQDADARLAYEHVLLVGGDSYDYTDNLGLGSISFIPTHYAATRLIPHTPSDALLADLDGDGLSDKAIGRWPVRSHGDLQAVVDKTIAWNDDPAPLQNAAFVTDTQDPGAGSFTGQAEALISMLESAGWTQQALDRIYYDELSPAPGLSIADTARNRLFGQLATGRSLTAFIGHGAPSMWTFQGLLVPDDLDALQNVGAPTLIGTLTCYTSYFVSPFSDTVAHRWMNGYREDGLGNRISGVANGAVAVHGAATLSSYDQNGLFARDVLDFQLAGHTLGQAVHLARGEAEGRGIDDLVINWTLLGDPTLRLD